MTSLLEDEVFKAAFAQTRLISLPDKSFIESKKFSLADISLNKGDIFKPR